uniref:glucuronosyltransferase n=1 Tax=Myotis myotis TaxID=51298 RepID=A0A7J8AMM1_MYOMY|nr:hypothetical protein mMyoMyo1_007859 [Myotis myotis]
MLSKKWALAVLLLQLCSAGCGFCGKVLVWPVDMSHWLNIKTILEELTKNGHEVLWRFEGKKPDTFEPNTGLYKWIPQNDLGHPKTKAFITHGGTNAIYETIYHGIPMVGIPMFADKPGNIARMKTKGAAIRMDFNTMSSADLLNALKTVINDPS